MVSTSLKHLETCLSFAVRCAPWPYAVGHPDWQEVEEIVHIPKAEICNRSFVMWTQLNFMNL